MADLRLARALLGAGYGNSDENVYESSGDSGPHDDTQTLRIVSIFVILATGLLGGVPPLFMKVFRDPDGTLTKLVRAFAAGVIMALALVHIIPEAVQEMAGLGGIEYPLGGTTVLFGVALMILLEHLAHLMNGNSSVSAVSPHTVAQLSAGCGAAQAAAPGGMEGNMNNNTNSSKLLVRGSTGDCGGGAGAGVDSTAVPPASASDGLASKSVALSVGGGGEGRGHGHGHVCVSRGPASNWLTAAAVEAVGSLRLKVVAYLFELGCIFHSFLIGLSLGVNKTDLTEVRSLLIALAFHQWLEGISLASVVIRGGFSRWRGCLMILTYSLTCPVGIAVGMAIASTYDGESERARGIQGTFNGVSGGMLLYISLVQLVAEDMGRLSPGRDSALSRMGSFVALFLGAASMCVLAIWA